jgi:hypothetical protein
MRLRSGQESNDKVRSFQHEMFHVEARQINRNDQLDLFDRARKKKKFYDHSFVLMN